MEISRIETNEDVGYEINKFILTVGSVLLGLIGIWGASCLIGGLIVAGGPIALAKSLLVAIAI